MEKEFFMGLKALNGESLTRETKFEQETMQPGERQGMNQKS